MTSMALAGNCGRKELDKRENILEKLSKARSLPAGFQEDKRSVYWENGIQSKDYTRTTPFVLSKRQEQLVYNKKYHPDYVSNHPNPIWRISRATLSALCTERLQHLSVPKQLHSDYELSRPVCPPIPRSALTAQPRPRTAQLAEHKKYHSLSIKPNSEWEWEAWSSDVVPSALNASATSRVTELATPKCPPKDYQPSRRVQWIVPRTVLLHTAGERLTKLANPKQLPGYQEDYNPNRWNVSKAALMAQPSPCIENLAKPIPRKCRQKKTI